MAPGVVTATCAQLETELRRQGVSQFSSVLTGALTFDAAASTVSFPLAHNDLGDRVAVALAEAIRAVVMKHSDASAAVGGHRSGRAAKSSTTSFANVSWILDLRGNSLTDAICGTFLLLLSSIEKVDLDLRSNPKISAAGIAQFQATGTVFRGSIKLDPVLVSTLDSTTESSSLPGLNRGPRGAVSRGRGVAPSAVVSAAGAAPAAAKPRHNAFGSSDDSDSDDGLALPGHRAGPPAATAAAAGARTSRSQPAPAARAATADASGAPPPSPARNRNAFSDDDDDDDDDLGLPGARPTPGRPANANANATAINGAGAGRKASEGHHATTPEGIIGMRQNRDRLFAKESVSPGSHHAHDDDDDDDDGLQFAPEGRSRPPNSNESKRQSHSGAVVSRSGGGGRRFSTDVAAANEFVKDSFTSASQDHATPKGSTSTAPKGKSAEKKAGQKAATAGKQKDDAKAKGGRPRRAGLVSTSSDDDTSSFDHNAPPAARSTKSKTTAREGKKNDRDGDGDDVESSSGSSFGVPNRARRAVDHAALNLSPLTSESPSPARGAAGRHGTQRGRNEAQAEGGGGRHRGAESSGTDKQSGTRKGGSDRHNADGGSPTGRFQRTVDFEEGSDDADDADAGSQHRTGHHQSANPKSANQKAGGGGVGPSAAASTDLSQTGDSLEGSPIAAGRNSGGARGSHGARDGDSDGDDGAGVGDHGDSTIEELQAVADDVATAVTERPDEQDELDITLNRSEYDVCCSLFLSGFAPDVLFEKIARDNAAQNLTILNIAQNRLESLPVLPRTLQRLDASNNMLTQIHGLHACPSLVVLNLRRNLLTRIEGLGACKLLGHLFLGRNALSEIDNIAHLSHLETLDVGFNRLSRPQDIRPLSMNKHLAHIIVEGNPLIENEVTKFLRGKKKAAARRKEVDSGASTAFSSFLIGGSSLAPARGNASGMASASGVVDVSKASRGAISRIGELCGTSSSFASSSASPIPKNGRGGRDKSGKTKAAGGHDDSVSSAGGLSSVTNMSAVEDKVTRTMLRQLLPQLMAINNQRVVSVTKGAGMMRSSSAGFALGRPGTRSGSLHGAGVASGRSPSDATLFQSMLQVTADRSARARPGTAAGNQSVTSGAGGGSGGGGMDDSFVNATGLVRQFTPTVGYSARSHTARSIRAIQSEHTRRELRENPRLRNISRLVRNEFKEEWRDADAGGGAGGIGGGGGQLSSGGAEGGGDGGDQPTGFITSGMEDSKHSLTQRYVDATITNDLVASANVSAARSGRTSANAHDQPGSAATGAGGQQNTQSVSHHRGETDLGQQQAHGSIGVDVGGVGAGAGGPAVVVPPLDIRLSQAHAAASSSATAHQASPHPLHHQVQQGQQQQRQGGQGYPNQQAGGGGQPQGYPQSNPQPMQSPRRVIYPPSSHETRDFAATSDMRLPLQQRSGGGPQGQPIGLPPQHRRQPSDRRLAPPGFSHTFDMDQIDGGGQGVGGAPRGGQVQGQNQGQGQGSGAYFPQGRRPVLSPTRADETKHLSPPRDTSAAALQTDHQRENQRGYDQGPAGYAQQHQQQTVATAAEALLLAGSHGQRSLTGAPHRLSVSHFGSSLAGQASNPNHSSANPNVHVNTAATGNDGFTTPRQMPPQRTEDLAELALRHLAETPPHPQHHQQRVDVRSDMDLSPRQNSDRRTGRGGGGGGGGSAPSPSVFSASALRSNSASGSGPVPGTARTNTNLSSGGVAGDALSFDSSNGGVGDGTGGLAGSGPHRRFDANAIPPVYTRDAPIGASTDVDAAGNHDQDEGWGPTTRTGTQPPQEEGLNSGGGGNGGGGGGNGGGSGGSGGRGLLQRSASASRQSKGARAASDASGRHGSKNDDKSEGIVAAPPMVTTWLSNLLVDEQAVSRGLETFVKVLRPMLTEREQQKENAAMAAAGLPPRYPDVPPSSRQNPSASLAETLPPDAIQCLEIILSADMLEDLDIPVAVRDFFAFSTAELVGDPSVVLPSERRAMPRARMAEIAGRGAAPPKGSVLRVVRRLGETRTFLRTVLALLQESRADAFWQCIAPVRNFTA